MVKGEVMSGWDKGKKKGTGRNRREPRLNRQKKKEETMNDLMDGCLDNFMSTWSKLKSS